MGLIAGALAIGARLLGIGATAVGTTARAAAPVARRLALPVGGAIAGGALFEAGAGLIGGDGGVAQPAALQAIIESGGQVTTLSGGRTMAVAPNGDLQLFNRTGMPIRPTIIIPAGNRLPGGAVVVSTRNNGQLIGLTVRRRRKQFASEARRVRNVLSICRSIQSAAAPRKRRSSHA